MLHPKTSHRPAARASTTCFGVMALCLAALSAGAEVPEGGNPRWMPHSDGVAPEIAAEVHESLVIVEVQRVPSARDLAAALKVARALCGPLPTITYRRLVTVKEIDLPQVESVDRLLEFSVSALPFTWRVSDGDEFHRSVDCDLLVGERAHDVRYVVGGRQAHGRSFVIPPGAAPLSRLMGPVRRERRGLAGPLGPLLGQAFGNGVPLLGCAYFVVRPIRIVMEGSPTSRRCALVSAIGCLPDSGRVDPYRGSQVNSVFDETRCRFIFGCPTP